ncbi:MAG: hemolysin family protein [Rickettsiaceae bacterium]
MESDLPKKNLTKNTTKTTLYNKVKNALHNLIAYIASGLNINYKSKLSLHDKISHLDKNKIGILNNFLDFNHKTVKDVMIPRSDIVSIELEASFEELHKIMVNSYYSRILIYQNNLDNVIGFIHIKDVMKAENTATPKPIKSLIRKHLVSVESTKLTSLLFEMSKQRTHIAVIVDEYGGTDGIVTISDITNEIFGEIEDEHETQNHHSYTIIDPATIIASGRVEIKEIEDLIDEKLTNDSDEHEFDTIAGLILTKTGEIPHSGAIVKLSEQITIEVLQANNRTVEKVKITLTNASNKPTKKIKSDKLP